MRPAARSSRSRLGSRGACHARSERALRRRHHRYRDARHGRLRADRGACARSAHRVDAGHRASSLVSRGSGRARAPGRLARLRRQVRPPGPHRGDQGADRRASSGQRDAMDDNREAHRLRHRHGRRPDVRPADRARAGGVPAGAYHARAARRRRRSPACSICAAGSSPRSTCAAASVCRRAARVEPAMAIGIESRGESFGLLVDAIGEVLNLPTANARPIRSISTAGSPAFRPAFTGSTTSFWWCSTSIACSMSAAGGGGMNGQDMVTRCERRNGGLARTTQRRTP